MNEEKIIRKEAEDFYKNILDTSNSYRVLEDIRDLKIRLNDFYTNESKAIFIDELEKKLVKDLTEHRIKAHNGIPKEDCGYEIYSEKFLFYLRQELSILPTIARQKFEITDENLKIISLELIDTLVKSGIVPTEAEQKESRAKSKKTKSKIADDLISKIFPKRTMAKIPKEFTSSYIETKIKSVVVDSKLKFNIIESNLLWKKLSLSNSDAQHVPNGTQPTHNLKLSQAKFKIDDKIIDQKIYFKENVFKKLEWEKTKKDKSLATEKTVLPTDNSIGPCKI